MGILYEGPNGYFREVVLKPDPTAKTFSELHPPKTPKHAAPEDIAAAYAKQHAAQNARSGASSDDMIEEIVHRKDNKGPSSPSADAIVEILANRPSRNHETGFDRLHFSNGPDYRYQSLYKAREQERRLQKSSQPDEGAQR